MLRRMAFGELETAATAEPGRAWSLPGRHRGRAGRRAGLLHVAGQQGRQEAEGLVLGLLPGGDHEPFEAGQARAHDLVGAELLAGELEEQGRPVVLQGPVDEPGLEGLQVAGPGLAKAEMGQDFLEVTRSGSGTAPRTGRGIVVRHRAARARWPMAAGGAEWSLAGTKPR